MNLAFLIRRIILILLLFLPLGVEAGYSQQEREQLCRSFSNYISDIAYFRDNGVPEKEMLKFIRESEDMDSETKSSTLYNIKRTYARTDLTAKQMAKMSFESCINPPIDI